MMQPVRHKQLGHNHGEDAAADADAQKLSQRGQLKKLIQPRKRCFPQRTGRVTSDSSINVTADERSIDHLPSTMLTVFDGYLPAWY